MPTPRSIGALCGTLPVGRLFGRWAQHAAPLQPGSQPNVALDALLQVLLMVRLARILAFAEACFLSENVVVFSFLARGFIPPGHSV
jgi:hypothetical protein